MSIAKVPASGGVAWAKAGAMIRPPSAGIPGVAFRTYAFAASGTSHQAVTKAGHLGRSATAGVMLGVPARGFILRPVAVVQIRRTGLGFRDSLRAYRVLLDGREVGRVRRGETRSFDVPPDDHELQLAIGSKRSASFDVAGDGDVVIASDADPSGAEISAFGRTASRTSLMLSGEVITPGSSLSRMMIRNRDAQGTLTTARHDQSVVARR